MALIKCPRCGKEISDKATACIHCGMPLKETEQPASPQPLQHTSMESAPPPNYLWFSIINIFISLIGGICLCILSATVKKMWADGNVKNAKRMSNLVLILNIIFLFVGIGIIMAIASM